VFVNDVGIALREPAKATTPSRSPRERSRAPSTSAVDGALRVNLACH
jgi:hypothetical protein